MNSKLTGQGEEAEVKKKLGEVNLGRPLSP